MEDKYNEQMRIHQEQLIIWQKRFQLLGYGKLVLLAALAWSLYRVYRSGGAPGNVVAAGVLLVVTVAAWLYHIRVHERVDLHRGLLAINQQYLDRISGRWTAFGDTGEDLLEGEHRYAADLDILGAKSLFQLISVANTWHGRRSLAGDLLEPGYPPEEIRRRQEAARELGDKTAFTNLFQYHAGKIKASNAVGDMIAYLGDTASAISPTAMRLLLWVPPLVALLTVFVFAAGIQGLFLPCIILLAAQGVFWVAGLPRTSRYLSPAASFPYLFRHYAVLLDLLGKESFQSPLLREMQQSLATGEQSAAKAIGTLDSIVSKVYLRNSGILYFALNVLVLWDYRCAVQLNRWKGQYGGLCEEWFLTIGSFESLLSLGGLPNVCANTCIPAIEEQRRLFQSKELGHPLIPNKTRVCNDLTLEEGMLIISGSNMSGKTTFLRTVGINLVLAGAGAAVLATEMRCSLFYLVTSMRIADDLGDGISTFYAELRQIARIIDAARQRENLFFLIDEIFRGTNSEDRLYGAAAVIRELSHLDRMGMITTHDLSLCELAQETGSIRNYSFSERYEGDEMVFDYRIEPGKSRTTNARFLMRKIGILTDDQGQ